MQISALISRAARYFGTAPCVSEGKRSLSFREFDQATDRVGNALRARGLATGDRVSIILPNSIDCLIAYYAVAKAGLVRVQLNTRETAENHRYKLRDSGSRGVIHADVEDISAEINIGWDELRDMLAQGSDAP